MQSLRRISSVNRTGCPGKGL